MIRKTTILLFITTVLVVKLVLAQANKALPAVFSYDASVLATNKSKVKANDALLLTAYKQLLKDADKALDFVPVSVMEKTNIPPSGDKHDYMSLAPYFWPDPSKADGMPYIRKDGQTNPEVKDYKDKDYFPKLCATVQTLSLAWYFSDDLKYADHASKLLRVWFLDSATRMNPNLNFSQAIKGQNDGRGAGLIDARHLINVVDAIGLLSNANSFKKEYLSGMKKWFTQFLQWMQTSKNGIDEMNAKNNHGTWYDAQRLSYALFVGENELAKKIVLNAEGRLDKQMDNDGNFPAELARTISLHYTVFVTDAFYGIAQMSKHANIDFWNYTSPGGKSLKKGFDKLLPYLQQDKKWEGEQIKDFKFEEGVSILAQAAGQFKCVTCPSAINKIDAENAKKSRINLLTNVEL